MSPKLCACGQPLHYHDPTVRRMVESMVEAYGETQTIMVAGVGAWKVPRHYYALHGLKAAEIPELARRYGWLRMA